VVFSPDVSSISATTTRAPSRAYRRATALPTPAPAPVTMATLSESRMMPPPYECGAQRVPSFRPEDAVAGVAQSRHDVAVAVQVAVDGGRVDRHVGMTAVEVSQPFGARDETDELDRARPGLLQAIDRRHRGMSGGEHRIHHDGVALGHRLRHLEIVLDG